MKLLHLAAALAALSITIAAKADPIPPGAVGQNVEAIASQHCLPLQARIDPAREATIQVCNRTCLCDVLRAITAGAALVLHENGPLRLGTE